MDDKLKVALSQLGEFLSNSREEANITRMELAYILDVKSQVTIYGWEDGSGFPRSIILIKKLSFLFPDLPGTIKEILNLRGVRPSVSEMYDFDDMLESEKNENQKTTKWKRYRTHKDKRDDYYRIAFGRYLRRSRRRESVSIYGLSQALSLSPNTIAKWESGENFPRSIITIGFLDTLYSNTIDMMFGVCIKNGIHLRKKEKKELIKRLKNRKNHYSSEYEEHYKNFNFHQSNGRIKRREMESSAEGKLEMLIKSAAKRKQKKEPK